MSTVYVIISKWTEYVALVRKWTHIYKISVEIFQRQKHQSI